jgi:RNA polymerase sigma-70 factor, ECF subfamily
MGLSEKESIKMLQKGDTDAFAFLVTEYSPRISRYLSKFLYAGEDVEDILQEVFIKAYVNIQSFDSSQPFSPWIYRIAHNEAINFLKKKKPQSFSLFDVDLLFPHPIAKETSDTESERALTKTMLDKVLGEIDIKYKEVLLLYFYEDFSYKEIASTLQIPVTTVGVRMTRGKNLARKLVKEKGIEISI